MLKAAGDAENVLNDFTHLGVNLVARGSNGKGRDSIIQQVMGGLMTEIQSKSNVLRVISKVNSTSRPWLTEIPEWKALQAHYQKIRPLHLRQLFKNDPNRGQRLAAEACGLYLDYSKNRITTETITLLKKLADACGLREHIGEMFSGVKINVSEERAVLHVALRAPKTESIMLDGVDVVAQVHSELDKMAECAHKIRRGEWLGYSGMPIRNIVNIGIGGSDLGPLMVYEALRYYSHQDLTFRFISNVDGTDFVDATQDLNPEETLFIICSKTFKTRETLINAQTARAWILAKLGDESAIAQHFIAVSTNVEAVIKFGIDKQHIFVLWDWDGGRYSLDSAIGLSTMIAIGPEHFRAMLSGFHAMDEHFRTAPLEKNLPALMGLLAVWNGNFFGAKTVAVLPYAQHLKRFPTYLQQLAMESNGKHVTLEGTRVDYSTGPIYWGELGNNGQHSFYQFIHQGTQMVPCDFIGFCQPLHSLQPHHDFLMANLFAQTQALAFGNNEDELKTQGVPDWQISHRSLEGNRPSNTLLAERLTPAVLGSLLALYEHSVFTQGIIWNIDSFDQWGVELGKSMAQDTMSELTAIDDPELAHDSSTNILIQRYRQLRDN